MTSEAKCRASQAPPAVPPRSRTIGTAWHGQVSIAPIPPTCWDKRNGGGGGDPPRFPHLPARLIGYYTAIPAASCESLPRPWSALELRAPYQGLLWAKGSSTCTLNSHFRERRAESSRQNYRIVIRPEMHEKEPGRFRQHVRV